jgi:23S rRNA (adenine-N6)-dimethyltransferase
VAVQRRPAPGAAGRHFLRSSRLAGDLVRRASVAAGELVVDVGAGSGALTEPLASTGAEVLAVERDPALVAQLRRRFASCGNVRVVEADALCWQWPERPFSVVANLPFAGSGAILARLLHEPGRAPLRVLAIVQWELAAKHAAVWPATLRGTYWRAWYDVAIDRRLDRTAFSPPPSVDAAVLAIERRDEPLVPLDRHQAYWRFLAGAFESRRPLLRTADVSRLALKRLAPVLGFAPASHPRDLDAFQWARLFAARDRRR